MWSEFLSPLAKECSFTNKEIYVNEFPLLVKECYEPANIPYKEQAINRYKKERSKAIMPASSPPFKVGKEE